MIRIASCCVLVTVTASGGAAAQDPRLAERVNADLLPRLQTVIDSATRGGLPVEPLIQKALEGSAAGAADARILSVVTRLRDHMFTARNVLGTDQDGDVLVAAADALIVGIPDSTVAVLAENDAPGALAMSLVVVTDLVRRGVADTTAARVVVSLAEASVDAAAFSTFRLQVERDIGAGAAPDAAAALRARGLLLSRPRNPIRHPRHPTYDALDAAVTMPGVFLAPRAAFAGERFAAGAEGIFAGGPDGRGAAAFRGFGRVEVPAVRGLAVEADVARADVPLSYARRSRSQSLDGRVRFQSTSLEAWFGAGRSRHAPGGTDRAAERMVIGGGVTVSATRLALAVTGSNFDDIFLASRDTVFTLAGYQFTSRRGDEPQYARTGYVEGEGSVARYLGPAYVRFAVGRRTGGERIDDRTWALGTVQVHVSTALSAVTQFGRHPGAPERLLSSRSVFTVGLRYSAGEQPERKPATDTDGAEPAATELTAVALVIRNLDARSIEVRGSVTDWRVRPMEEVNDGVWWLDLTPRPGVHRLTIRIDGGSWEPPPNVPVADEDFGAVGVVVLGR